MNNILLCGFMGCGKTSVGKLLSKRLHMEYIDLDDQIAADAGMPISEIFSRFGETYFRDLEHEAVAGLSKRISCIVSTGGGAMTFLRNVQVVDPRDSVVFLDASFSVCYERIRNSDRPLVQNNSKEALYKIFDERYQAYLAAAKYRVDADRDPETVTGDILRLFSNQPSLR